MECKRFMSLEGDWQGVHHKEGEREVNNGEMEHDTKEDVSPRS